MGAHPLSTIACQVTPVSTPLFRQNRRHIRACGAPGGGRSCASPLSATSRAGRTPAPPVRPDGAGPVPPRPTQALAADKGNWRRAATWFDRAAGPGNHRGRIFCVGWGARDRPVYRSTGHAARTSRGASSLERRAEVGLGRVAPVAATLHRPDQGDGGAELPAHDRRIQGRHRRQRERDDPHPGLDQRCIEPQRRRDRDRLRPVDGEAPVRRLRRPERPSNYHRKVVGDHHPERVGPAADDDGAPAPGVLRQRLHEVDGLEDRERNAAGSDRFLSPELRDERRRPGVGGGQPVREVREPTDPAPRRERRDPGRPRCSTRSIALGSAPPPKLTWTPSQPATAASSAAASSTSPSMSATSGPSVARARSASRTRIRTTNPLARSRRTTGSPSIPVPPTTRIVSVPMASPFAGPDRTVNPAAPGGWPGPLPGAPTSRPAP